MKNILICLLLSSFASYSQKNILAYNIYYYKNPEHKIKQYENILVITNAHPKTYRLLLKAARKNKYKIILSDVLFPEQKKYSEKDVAKIIRDNNIDGILYYTILGTTSTEIDLGTHSTYTTPNKDGVGTIVTQQRTSTYKFTKIEATFIEPKSKHDTIFYCYGGIEGKSFAITYKAFDNILMKFKKIGVALPLEKDDSNKLIVSDETLKINEYLKYEEQALNDFENKKYNESILNYNKVIELSPNYIDAYFNRAKAKSELGDYEGSIVDNSKAIELKPDFSMAYNNRGWCKLLQKKTYRRFNGF